MMSDAPGCAVRATGITKRFPGVVANKSIDFDVMTGEIHGLLGENGAGKTTLSSILSGYYQPDEGEIYVRGKLVRINSPKDALRLGIGMVYQHFSLVPRFKVVENVLLGLDVTGQETRDLKTLANAITQRSAELGFSIDPWAEVSELSIGEQQRVEILKVLFRGASIIILDEPTSVLAPVEVEGLFRTIKSLAGQGRSVVFITHKLVEALEFCDRITVLRSGTKVGTLSKSELRSTREIVQMMFGAEIEPTATRAITRVGNEVLRAEGIVVENDLGQEVVRDASLTLHRGEVLGLAGVEGNGQKELAEALAAIRPLKAGRILIGGKSISGSNPAEQYDLGVAYITDDRVAEGLVRDLSVSENLVLKSFRRPPYRKGFVIDWRTVEKETDQLIEEYGIVARGPKSIVRTLSGGNLQKLLVARELSSKPIVLIANQPTHGLDARTTQYIHQKLIEQASQGTAVILISNDLDEVFSLSDTIAVIFRGEIIGLLPREQATKEQVAHLMVGLREDSGGAQTSTETS
jgi:simple sugar transport system ATP-binding protein